MQRPFQSCLYQLKYTYPSAPKVPRKTMADEFLAAKSACEDEAFKVDSAKFKALSSW